MAAADPTFEFDEFRLDVGKRLLHKAGQAVAVLPKAFDLLVFLVQQRHRALDKDEILAAVWPGTFVSEANLTQNISVLRKALGESPREHRYIVTIPGRGYRFAGHAREITPALGDRTRAQQLTAKGRHLLNKRLTETIGESITWFLQATDEDPEYAPAWVGLADAYALLSLYGASLPQDVFPKSRAAAQNALRFDPSLAEAHNAIGVVELFFQWDWPAANRAFREALALNPEYADAHQRYAVLLIVMERFEEARQALARAQALDPLSRIIATFAGYPAYYARDYEAAIRQFRVALQMDPNFSMAHFRLGLALAHQGDFDGAIAELNTSKQLSNDRDVVAALGRVHAMRGDRAAAEAALAELAARSKDTFVTSYALAAIYAAMGDSGTALDWLERALAERSYWMIYLNVDPALDSLRAEPRFAELRKRAGLAE
jgi:DNA-binding winged helix-turn-helix (wHTH) protein/Flp pilus assembly protein TadD